MRNLLQKTIKIVLESNYLRVKAVISKRVGGCEVFHINTLDGSVVASGNDSDESNGMKSPPCS